MYSTKERQTSLGKIRRKKERKKAWPARLQAFPELYVHEQNVSLAIY